MGRVRRRFRWVAKAARGGEWLIDWNRLLCDGALLAGSGAVFIVGLVVWARMGSQRKLACVVLVLALLAPVLSATYVLGRADALRYQRSLGVPGTRQDAERESRE